MNTEINIDDLKEQAKQAIHDYIETVRKYANDGSLAGSVYQFVRLGDDEYFQGICDFKYSMLDLLGAIADPKVNHVLAKKLNSSSNVSTIAKMLVNTVNFMEELFHSESKCAEIELVTLEYDSWDAKALELEIREYKGKREAILQRRNHQ